MIKELNNCVSPENRDKFYFYTLFFIVAIIVLVNFVMSVPVDDFNRHSTSFKFDFNYQSLYGDSGYPFQNNYWFFYEKTIEFITKQYGEGLAVHVVGLVFFVFFIYPFLLNSRLSDNNLLFFFIIYSAVCVSYFTNLRPASLASTLVISAFLIRYTNINKQVKNFIYLISAMIIVFIYHGFFIFLIPMLLLNGTVVFFSMASGTVIWLFFTSGEWFDFISTLSSISSNNSSEITISELQFPYFFILLMGSIYLLTKDKFKANYWQGSLPIVFAFIVLSILTPQIRFYYLVFPLFLLWIISSVNKNIRYETSAVALFFLLTINSFPGIKPSIAPNSSVLFEGKKVFCASMGDMHLVSRTITGPTLLYPSMDPRINQPEYFDLMTGKKDVCEYLRQNDFDYYVESKSNVTYECLTLHSSNAHFRTWSVNKN